jgi:hypothetical protein
MPPFRRPWAERRQAGRQQDRAAPSERGAGVGDTDAAVRGGAACSGAPVRVIVGA